MSLNFNEELHARPSMYFKGPATVEHMALMLATPQATHLSHCVSMAEATEDAGIRTQVEYHTEFVTVTRVTPLSQDVDEWPKATLRISGCEAIAGICGLKLVSCVSILVQGPAPSNLGVALTKFAFGDTAASSIGGGSAQVCSDFRVGSNLRSRILLFNKDLNAYRLGRMVWVLPYDFKWPILLHG